MHSMELGQSKVAIKFYEKNLIGSPQLNRKYNMYGQRTDYLIWKAIYVIATSKTIFSTLWKGKLLS